MDKVISLENVAIGLINLRKHFILNRVVANFKNGQRRSRSTQCVEPFPSWSLLFGRKEYLLYCHLPTKLQQGNVLVICVCQFVCPRRRVPVIFLVTCVCQSVCRQGVFRLNITVTLSENPTPEAQDIRPALLLTFGGCGREAGVIATYWYPFLFNTLFNTHRTHTLFPDEWEDNDQLF